MPTLWPRGSQEAAASGALLLLCLALCPTARAVADSRIDPDRPDVTDSAQTVPVGALQIETGVEYSYARVAASPAERQFSLQTRVRTGLTGDLEVALDWDPVVWRRQERDDVGIGDLTLGLKYRFFSPAEGQPWPALALEPFVKAPTAREPIGSGRPDFEARLIASLDLPGGFDLNLNAGLGAVGQQHPDGFLLQALASGSLSYAITERLSALGEIFYASKDQRDGRQSVGLTVGLMYWLTPNLVIDGAMRTVFAGQGPDWAILGGLSVRLGR